MPCLEWSKQFRDTDGNSKLSLKGMTVEEDKIKKRKVGEHI